VGKALALGSLHLPGRVIDQLKTLKSKAWKVSPCYTDVEFPTARGRYNAGACFKTSCREASPDVVGKGVEVGPAVQEAKSRT